MVPNVGKRIVYISRRLQLDRRRQRVDGKIMRTRSNCTAQQQIEGVWRRCGEKQSGRVGWKTRQSHFNLCELVNSETGTRRAGQRTVGRCWLQYKYLIGKLFGKQRVLKLAATRRAFTERGVAESASATFQQRTWHLTLKLKSMDAKVKLLKTIFSYKINWIELKIRRKMRIHVLVSLCQR